HHGEYEFGSPKLPMIREALAFHYMDDLDSKMGAIRSALAVDSGEPDWSAYSGALGRKFLRLDKFLNPPRKPQTQLDSLIRLAGVILRSAVFARGRIST